MTTLYLAMQDSIVEVRGHENSRSLNTQLVGTHTECIAADPHMPHRVYCGTNKDGVWRSDDAGETWQPLSLTWPARYRHRHVQGLAITL